ncbi:hypothetical protein HOY80DRAFT_882445, partial [Tuber brumale]
QQSVGLVEFPAWVSTMDGSRDIQVEETAGKHLQVINLKRPEILFGSGVSPLNWQPLMVTWLPDAAG